MTETAPDTRSSTTTWTIGGVAVVIAYPVYAIVLGLIGNVVLTQLGVRDRLAGGFRTEF